MIIKWQLEKKCVVCQTIVWTPIMKSKADNLILQIIQSRKPNNSNLFQTNIIWWHKYYILVWKRTLTSISIQLNIIIVYHYYVTLYQQKRKIKLSSQNKVAFISATCCSIMFGSIWIPRWPLGGISPPPHPPISKHGVHHSFSNKNWSHQGVCGSS